jgi:hypothetical protein
VLTGALAAGGDEAKRAFHAMMGMKKIDIAAIEAARLKENFFYLLLPHLVTPRAIAPQPATPGPVTDLCLIVIIVE